MTQFTGVLVAHAQPFLYAQLVYETEATSAVTRTNNEFSNFCLRVPGYLTDPTVWCRVVTFIDTETFNWQRLCWEIELIIIIFLLDKLEWQARVLGVYLNLASRAIRNRFRFLGLRFMTGLKISWLINRMPNQTHAFVTWSRVCLVFDLGSVNSICFEFSFPYCISCLSWI